MAVESLAEHKHTRGQIDENSWISGVVARAWIRKIVVPGTGAEIEHIGKSI